MSTSTPFDIFANTARTDKPIVKVHAAGPEDVDRALKAAKAALGHPSWKLLPATDRGRLMSRLADLIEENQELLATIDAWDNGSCCQLTWQVVQR